MIPEDVDSGMKLVGVMADVKCCHCGDTTTHQIGAGNLNGCDIMVACHGCGRVGAIYWEDLFGEGI